MRDLAGGVDALKASEGVASANRQVEVCAAWPSLPPPKVTGDEATRAETDR
jgi:hypothetical protein